jgi:short-subunit dehydrogenase
MTQQTALITGASSGIGATFAHHLARRGYGLILVARSKDKLEALAAELRAVHGTRVDVLPADLAQPAPGAALKALVDALGLDVDLLVNNAGFGAAGAFHTLPAARQQEMIALNVAAVVDLAQTFLPGMVERGRGDLINVASLAGFQPMPFMSVYGASKAFVLSFSEALWAEYRGRGIRVLAVCPGPVDTPFFEATGADGLRDAVPSKLVMSAEAVVVRSLRALDAGEMTVVPGATNNLVTALPRLLPRRFLAWSTGRAMQRQHPG